MSGHKSSVLGIHIPKVSRSIRVVNKGKQEVRDVVEPSKIQSSNPIFFNWWVLGRANLN